MDDQQHARAMAGWIARAAAVCRELAAQHADLGAYVAHGTRPGPPSDGVGIRGTRIEQPVPIDVEVVDVRRAIETDARRYADLARGTLRIKGAMSTTTAGRLGVVADRLPDLHAADPDLAAEVVEKVWDHHRIASRIVEPPRGLRPFRIEETCPACGMPSLWVDPAGWRIGCGMPSCRRVWGVADPILKESSVSETSTGGRASDFSGPG
ncbi:hypothetical protein NYO98_10590 [Nocardioides sp. STR2]|uniref:SCP1.201-like deaminase n=1 Tax=Nocardioides pini TaxID=2975053 RepID=A0ABT4CCP0_9ACTN|nr:hypothetical protein [Nocardioides pini]MCY4726726.1 hypothetical protein [Nocardioides pini]